MTTRPLLEIALHLNNGRTHSFLQNDPVVVQEFLQQITLKVFTQPSLVVAGKDRVTAYQGTALTGISLIMEPVPQELLTFSLFPVLPQEITENDYRARQPEIVPLVEGAPGVTLNEIEFTSGHRLWLEVQLPQATSRSHERHLLHSIFSGPGLICRRLGGGVTLWNRAQMISFSLMPQIEVPANAWMAEFMASEGRICD